MVAGACFWRCLLRLPRRRTWLRARDLRYSCNRRADSPEVVPATPAQILRVPGELIGGTFELVPFVADLGLHRLPLLRTQGLRGLLVGREVAERPSAAGHPQWDEQWRTAHLRARARPPLGSSVLVPAGSRPGARHLSHARSGSLGRPAGAYSDCHRVPGALAVCVASTR